MKSNLFNKIDKRQLVRIPLFILAAIMVVLIYDLKNKKDVALASIQFLPQIHALDISGDSVWCNSLLDTMKRTAIVFFHPECEYCRAEIEGIIERNRECQSVQWMFITIAQPEELESFLKDYPIESIPNAFLLREDFPENHIRFGVSGPPSLFIYDEHGNLMKMHRGATSIRTIVAELM